MVHTRVEVQAKKNGYSSRKLKKAKQKQESYSELHSLFVFTVQTGLRVLFLVSSTPSFPLVAVSKYHIWWRWFTAHSFVQRRSSTQGQYKKAAWFPCKIRHCTTDYPPQLWTELLLQFQELYAYFPNLTLKILKKWLETIHPYHSLPAIPKLYKEVKKNLVPPRFSHKEEAGPCQTLQGPSLSTMLPIPNFSQFTLVLPSV